MKKIYKKIEDYLLGSKGFLRTKLEKIYEPKEANHKLELFRKRQLFYYGVLGSVALLMLVISGVYTLKHSGYMTTIKRPAYYENSKNMRVQIESRYGEYTQKKDLELVVKPEKISEAKAQKLFNQSEKAIKKTILGENKGFNHIIYPLNLPKKEEKTKVKITWQSDHPEIIGENGYVNTFIEEEKKKVALVAKLEIGNYTKKVAYNFTVKRKINAANIEKNMTAKIEAEIKALSSNQKGDYLFLPKKTDSEIQLKWTAGKANFINVILGSILATGLFLFFNRYKYAETHVKKKIIVIQQTFPEFVNQFLLLINAGLTPMLALNRIIEQYDMGQRTGHETNPLYDALKRINEKVYESNGDFFLEFNGFAKKTGLKELLRFSSVLNETIKTGNDFYEKLERESSLLWNSRKALAEEAGKVAETKLTLPLVILLGVLLMIVITPVLNVL